MGAFIAYLAAENLPQCRVEDPSKEVFWNEWIEDNEVRRLMLLNTDWTAAGNRKKVTVDTGKIRFETEVVEREAKILTVLPGMVLEPDDFELHLEVLKSGKVRCHGTGKHRITVHKADGSAKIKTVDLTKTTAAEIPLV